MDEIKMIKILEEIKPIKTIKNTDLLNSQMICEYFEINNKTFGNLFKRNHGINNVILDMYETKKLLSGIGYGIENKRGYFICNGYKYANNHNRFIRKTEMPNIALSLSENNISMKFKDKLYKNEKIRKTRKEIEFINELEQFLKPFNITGERQYNILNYRIDFYIPSMDIAIEYDEDGHSGYTYEQHEGRQKEIEEVLGCKFIRMYDDKSNAENLGIIAKELFNF